MLILILHTVDWGEYFLAAGKAIWIFCSVLGTFLFTTGDDLYSAPKWIETAGNIVVYGSIMFMILSVFYFTMRRSSI